MDVEAESSTDSSRVVVEARAARSVGTAGVSGFNVSGVVASARAGRVSFAVNLNVGAEASIKTNLKKI